MIKQISVALVTMLALNHIPGSALEKKKITRWKPVKSINFQRCDGGRLQQPSQPKYGNYTHQPEGGDVVTMTDFYDEKGNNYQTHINYGILYDTNWYRQRDPISELLLPKPLIWEIKNNKYRHSDNDPQTYFVWLGDVRVTGRRKGLYINLGRFVRTTSYNGNYRLWSTTTTVQYYITNTNSEDLHEKVTCKEIIITEIAQIPSEEN